MWIYQRSERQLTGLGGEARGGGVSLYADETELWEEKQTTANAVSRLNLWDQRLVRGQHLLF